MKIYGKHPGYSHRHQTKKRNDNSHIEKARPGNFGHQPARCKTENHRSPW